MTWCASAAPRAAGSRRRGAAAAGLLARATMTTRTPAAHGAQRRVLSQLRHGWRAGTGAAGAGAAVPTTRALVGRAGGRPTVYARGAAVLRRLEGTAAMRAYKRACTASPWLSAFGVCLVKGGLSDVFAQSVVERKDLQDVDWRRTVRLARRTLRAPLSPLGRASGAREGTAAEPPPACPTPCPGSASPFAAAAARCPQPRTTPHAAVTQGDTAPRSQQRGTTPSATMRHAAVRTTHGAWCRGTVRARARAPALQQRAPACRRCSRRSAGFTAAASSTSSTTGCTHTSSARGRPSGRCACAHR